MKGKVNKMMNEEEFKALYNSKNDETRLFKSIFEFGTLWKLCQLDNNDVNGKPYRTKDGKFKMVKLGFKCDDVDVKESIYLSLYTLKYKVENLTIGAVVEFIEIEPSVDISAKIQGVNKGRPKNIINQFKIKDYKIIKEGF